MARRTCGSSWLTKSELAKVLSPPLFFNTFFFNSQNNIVNVVLYLGDQVYGQKEFQDAQAVLRYSGHPREGADDIDTARPEAKCLHKGIAPLESLPLPFSPLLPNCAFII